ncbi:hypothetical protein C7S18_20110 [Ahniella affigens]|uniref:RecBCD enzyme subunit RecC n=1 Tax=Ahniella affigens TaxID=2021234 RepID=A0A2P1PWX0_9GAMM|nr:exodeoxyribonuclease V subunit gamma [Ahniella affigens]AVP99332.1 hypothetical protein C7S18_20110 [Ahniella affigens]
MSFIVRHAARLEWLADALSADLAAHQPAQAFAMQTIIVAHPGMSRWLRAALAERSPAGIAAGYEFLLPGEWLERLSVVDPDLLSDKPELLHWLLYDLLSQAPFDSRPYSEPGQSAVRRFRRAGALAELFHRYSIYRADWIDAFERGQSIEPQAALWRTLKEMLGAETRTTRISRQRHALKVDTTRRDDLWVFGLNHCPPDLLELFRLYGQRAQVRWYFQNPCREFWLDLYQPRQLTKAQIAKQAGYAESGPPLLSQLGTSGRDLFEALLDVADQDEELAAEWPEQQTRLALLQTAIHQNQAKPRWPADAHDHSLVIHACSTEWGELEAVREALDRAVLDAPDLRPDEVLIMAVDPSAYRPWLHAVFSASAPAWPIRVADLNWLEHDPWFQLLETLLTKADAPIRRSVWLAVLRHPEVSRHWHIDPALLDKLEQALDRVHASFGWDGADRGDGSDQHSLGAGLGRLWSRYAADTALEPWTLVGLEASLLARAESVLALLHAWHKLAQNDHSLTRWCQLLRRWLARLLGPIDAEFRAPREVLASLLAGLEQEALLTECHTPLPISAFAECLRDRLRQPAAEAPTPAGGIRFSGLVPFRSLPFRFIAVLGLNADQFPRQDPGLGPDDLLKWSPRQRLDRDRRVEDRYLFLEAILNAREWLHLSYVSKAAKDGSEQAPSNLLMELAQVLDVAEGAPQRSLEKTPVRSWWRHGPLLPHAPERFERGSFASAWLPAARRLAQGTTDAPDWEAARLRAVEGAPERLSLHDLLDFVAHPGRWFVQRRLGIRFDEGREADPDLEPLRLKSRGTSRLERELLEASLSAGHVLEQVPERWHELAELPAGRLGEMSFAALRDTCAERWKQVTPEVLQAWQAPTRVLPIDFGLVHGELTLRGDALVLSDPYLNPGRVMSALLALRLAAASDRRPKQLVVIAEWKRPTAPRLHHGMRLPSVIHIPVSDSNAPALCEPYVSACRNAYHAPLLLPLEAAQSAWNYVEADPSARVREAEKAFESNAYSGRNDWCWRLLTRGTPLFTDALLAQQFLDQAAAWFAPVFEQMQPYGPANASKK